LANETVADSASLLQSARKTVFAVHDETEWSFEEYQPGPGRHYPSDGSEAAKVHSACAEIEKSASSF
jgi:hypothetical protein